MALKWGVAVARRALARGSCGGKAGGGWPREASGLVQLKKISRVLPPRDKFVSRHIGPRSQDIDDMLRALGLQVRTARQRYVACSVLASAAFCALHRVSLTRAVLGGTDAEGHP